MSKIKIELNQLEKIELTNGIKFYLEEIEKQLLLEDNDYFVDLFKIKIADLKTILKKLK